MRDPEGIGDWPRRLLHVPTMTSMVWRPGNLYGDFESPAYNAVSYTWGRFRLDQGGKPRPQKYNDIQGLPIRGVEWTVPPINPEHFQEQELSALLKRMTWPSSVEFVWIDIACIDQRRGSEEGSLEVGRQAAIFRGARHVFIWWTGLGGQQTRQLWDQIVSSPDLGIELGKLLVLPREEEDGERLASIQNVDSCITLLLSDPWFSSLWTLQEAALAHEAQVLCRDGEAVFSGGGPCNGFEHISGIINQFNNDCMRALVFAGSSGGGGDGIRRTHPRTVALFANICRVIQRVALPELRHGNRLALYAAAGRRTATEPCDYVYGIQQIFRYRVGATAEAEGGGEGEEEGRRPDRGWSLAELEVELGKKILADHPVDGQMHVFQEPVARGRRWHIGLSSRVPVPLAGMGHAWTALWELGARSQHDVAVQRVDGLSLARFRGRTCDYGRLHASWMLPPAAANGETSYFRVLLDAVSADEARLSGEPPEYRAVGHMRDIWPGSEQNAMSAWLASAYDPSRLRVLRLGSRGGDVRWGSPDPREIVGLILLRAEPLAGSTYWQRLGFCYWLDAEMCADYREAREFLAARDDSPGWIEESGFFG